MAPVGSRGPVVVNTDVYSARLVPDSQLRVACQRAGHALSQRQHDADRWIAATAVRLGVPLVSNDGVFRNTPGLVLETVQN